MSSENEGPVQVEPVTRQPQVIIVRREPDGAGAFFFGMMIGGLVGTLAALWRAPASGAELRARLLRRGDQLRAQAEQVVAGERVEDAIAQGKALAQQRRTQTGSGK